MRPPFANAFSGRSVFVTGHTGFKGSWLCLWLEFFNIKFRIGFWAAIQKTLNIFAAAVAQEAFL